MKPEPTTGWVGIGEGKLYFEPVLDSYCEGTKTVTRLEVFITRRAARKRFQKVCKVVIKAATK